MSDERSPGELLQSALSSAFTPVSLAPEPPSSSPKPDSAAEITATAAAEAAATSASAPLVSQEDLAKYEEERAALENSWREQSAVQRKEAEERRARIATERAASGESWEKLDEGKPLRGPPNQMSGSSAAAVSGSGYPGSPSPADARGVVSGEPSGSRHIEVSAQVSPRTTATLEHSQRWEEIEDVPSMESSYPSLSFPEHSDSAPSDNAGSKSKSAEKPTPVALPSTTLSVFDSRLSTRSRVIALLSSLSINLFLPFVNGVMLGFGEIFARNMAFRFFGWGIPGGAATAVGVNATRR